MDINIVTFNNFLQIFYIH